MKYMLAPMEDTSDNALRALCFKHGADLTFTEMAMLKGVIKGNRGSLRRIEILDAIPTQIQLAVQKENHLASFLKTYEPPKGFAGINLNLGCPSPHLVKEGLGCALMKRVSKVNRLVKQIKDKGYTASIKMRLGLNQFEKKKEAYLNLLNGVDADFFVIHARHGAEHYENPADYSVYSACVETGKEIIANGDVDTLDKVMSLKKMGVAGVMIGRAAVTDPGIFDRLKGIKEVNSITLQQEYTELAEKYGSLEKYKNNVLKRLGQKQSPYNEENMRG